MSATSHQVYQVRARVLCADVASAVGKPDATLADVPTAYLKSLRDAGFTMLYLLGVWQTGEAGLVKSREEVGDADVDGVCSSPFAITGYTVRPELGGDETLKQFRKRLNDNLMLLMVDFVPNHVALDHPWVLTHRHLLMHGTPTELDARPDVYFKAQDVVGPFLPEGKELPPDLVLAHGRDPNFGGWTDTIQLNYWHPDTHAAMGGILKHIAAELADGVRCDMAMLETSDVFKRTWGRPDAVTPPPSSAKDWPGIADTSEFWPKAIAACKEANAKFVFLAEVYWDMEYTMQTLGFDYTYDKRLLDRLEAVEGPGVVAHLQADLEFQRRSARMIENHDEKRAATAFHHGPEHHFAAAIVAMTVPGIRVFHDGQLQGRKVFHSMHYGPRPSEEEDGPVSGFYARLLSVLRSLSACSSSTWRQLPVTPSDDGSPSWGNIVAHSWSCPASTSSGAFSFGGCAPMLAGIGGGALRASTGACLHVVVVNMSTESASGHVQLVAGSALADTDVSTLLLHDLLSTDSIVRTVDAKGLWFGLRPFEAHVYAVTPAGPT